MATCTGAASLSGYLRVAAMAIALYDALWTIPSEIAIYRDQKSFTRMSRACILFILIRYSSVTAMVVSNVGFFSTSFTQEACQHYYRASPTTKVLQTMVSQTILAVRTIAVSRQAPWVVWLVGALFIVSVGLEFFFTMWRRIPFREPAGALYGNCSSGNQKGARVAWIYYLVVMIYDGTCLLIAVGYIYRQNRGHAGRMADGITKLLLKEGLLYFCFLTAVNVLNLVMYITGSSEAQTAAANLGYAFTWIMSQRLLIHLHEYSAGPHTRSRTHSASQGPTTNKPGSRFPNFIATRTGPGNMDEIELDGVHVSVEEAVKVDYDVEIVGSGGIPMMNHHQITNDAKNEKEPRREGSSMEGKIAGGKGWQVTTVGKMFPQ